MKTVPLHSHEPTLNRARNIAEEILELYLHNELDEVYIIYTSMINAIQEETQMSQLLPLKKADFTVQIPYRHTEGGAGTQAIA